MSEDSETDDLAFVVLRLQAERDTERKMANALNADLERAHAEIERLRRLLNGNVTSGTSRVTKVKVTDYKAERDTLQRERDWARSQRDDAVQRVNDLERELEERKAPR